MHIRRLAVVAISIGAVVGLAGCISNPGNFTMTVVGGYSQIVVKNGGGTATLGFGLNPACSDGKDNDLDGLTDYPNDTRCASASDAAENVAGLQTYNAPTLPISVASDGTITATPTSFTFPEYEVYGLGMKLVGTGGSVSSYASGGTTKIDIPFRLDLRSIDSLAGMSPCSIGPSTMTLSQSSYDASTGVAVWTATAPAPAVTGCGSSYNSTINSVLGLPGTMEATLTGIVSDGSGNHPHG